MKLLGKKHRQNALTDAIKRFFFPEKCPVCMNLFYKGAVWPPGWEAPFLCQKCADLISPVKSPFCSVCGVMFETDIGSDHICGDCITSGKYFKMARSFGLYDRTIKTLIHRLKFDKKIRTAGPLGWLLFSIFIRVWRKIDIVAPIPLHLKRLKERGFNQSFLLIRDWTCFAEGIIDSKFEIDPNLLIRIRYTKPQTGLKRKKRLANIKNAFIISKPDRIKGKTILLVDDVLTTGATVDECSKILMSSGARQVNVLTVARTMT